MSEPVTATAIGPMVLAAVEQYEPIRRRLVDDEHPDHALVGCPKTTDPGHRT